MPEESNGLSLISSERIRAARDLRGYSQKQAIERMAEPVTVTALSLIEAGKFRPTPDTARSLADAFDVPVEFFTIRSAQEYRELSGAFFRDLRSTPARERRRASAMALLLSDLVAMLETEVQLPEVDVPQRPLSSSATRTDIEAAAEVVRDEWGLDEDPIPHVIRDMERHGIVVARLSVADQRVDAFAVPFRRRPVVLLSNDKDNYVRSRFDAAHELGHLVAHAGADRKSVDVERQAHDFASAFLLPATAARDELPRRLDPSGWAKLADMKREWGVSIASLLYRAHGLGILAANDYRNAMKLMSARGWRKREPGDKEMGPPESPLLLQRAIQTVVVHKGITIEDIIATAHLPTADVLDLIEASNDPRPTIEL